MTDWMKLADIGHDEITPETVYRERRTLMMAAGLGLLGGVAGTSAQAKALAQPIKKSPFSTAEPQTSFEAASQYNNFYELGTGKEDPVRNAAALTIAPWSVRVDGECDGGGDFALEDILKPHAIEERIYRLRCVEAWSMVIPWNGFALADLLKRFKPNSNARYVAFETTADPELPGIASPVLNWPYREGLRMDEAMHPLSFIAIGIYGQSLPNQNGAPLRLVVPWKYGFKSIKSIVRISFVKEQPPTSWNMSAPHEYGFYSNVNPQVSHPRWSQARERRLTGEQSGLSALFTPKIDTLPFNGYAEAVASLYTGMDLKKQF